MKTKSEAESQTNVEPYKPITTMRYLVSVLTDNRHDWAYRIALACSQIRYELAGI